MSSEFGPLFDIPAAEAARDRGMALAGAAEIRTRLIDKAIYHAAMCLPEVTSDDAWEVLRGHGITWLDHPNAFGAAMRRASLAGYLEPTGTVRKSARPSAHRRNVVVWRSRIFCGGAA